jgi:hypothetical protein
LQIAQLKIKGINNRIKIAIEHGPENKKIEKKKKKDMMFCLHVALPGLKM